MNDEIHYYQKQQQKEIEWEGLCRNCGACCGAFDDPCEHLIMTDQGSRCAIYEFRFGHHKTISGDDLKCVPIRNILHENWIGSEGCTYKQNLK